MTKTVLFVSQRPSDYVEMKRCALALVARGYRTVFLYHRVSEDDSFEAPILADMKALKDAKQFSDVVVVETGQTRRGLNSLKKRHNAPARFTPRWFAATAFYLFFGAVYLAARPLRVLNVFMMRYRYYLDLIRERCPDIIILPEDVVGSVSPLMIRAGQACGVPSLIMPYTIANQQEAYRSLGGYPNLRADRWFNLPIAKLCRRWVMEQGGLAVLRLPADYILAHSLLRVSPPDPWMMNSGFANAIAVENAAMYDYYAAAGISPGKMNVVGAIYDDYLAEILNNKADELNRVRSDLGIQSAKPLLLIAGCPDQSGSCPCFEFSSIEEFAGKLADAVKQLSGDYEIVVRPHPNFPALGELLAKQGMLVTMIDSARLVAVSDAFIAFGSATIRWAVACAVPTINYDVFRYDYSDFKNVSCVVSVTNYQEFMAAILAMRPGEPALERLRTSARSDAERWGKLDGHSVDRIVALIENLISTKPVPRTAY